MTQFVYFTTDKSKAPDYAGPCSARMKGPGDQEGLFLSADADSIRYLPDQQEWIERADGVWVGVNRDRPMPTPDGLAKPKQLPGPEVTLADGNRWVVSQLRVFASEHGWAVAVPTRMKLVDGEWQSGEVLPEFADADALGEDLLARMLAAYESIENPDATDGMTFADAAGYVARVLAVNYRVGPEELSLLGALPMDGRLGEVLRAATDYDSAEAWVEKKLAAPGA